MYQFNLTTNQSHHTKIHATNKGRREAHAYFSFDLFKHGTICYRQHTKHANPIKQAVKFTVIMEYPTQETNINKGLLSRKWATTSLTITMSKPRKFEITLCNLFEHFHLTFGLERRVSAAHFVGQDTNSPPRTEVKTTRERKSFHTNRRRGCSPC